jgi:uncharacterized FlaG/YvyC family protein
MEVLKVSTQPIAEPEVTRASTRVRPEAPRQAPRSAPERAQGSAGPAEAAQVEEAAQTLAARFDLKVELAQDEVTGRKVVRIFSRDGERLLRQMPPEEVLKLAQRARLGTLENLLTSVV